MPDIHGNIEGLRNSVLDEMKTLYDLQLEPDVFLPQEVLSALCGWSASFNREVALYVTRYGEIADIFIGRADAIDLPDLRLRRSQRRLSMIRCIHTHPSATGQLSDVDLSALLSMRFDAMCAVGVNAEGQPTSTQCAFLDQHASAGYVLTELLPARRLPQQDWLDHIQQADAAYLAEEEKLQKDHERAVLVGIESEESLDELEELAKTAGAETVLRVLQKRPSPDTAFCIGKGKAEELSLRCQAVQADLVIFDEVLSGVMQKNLEEVLHIKVVDRTALILDIFAARASTREGKLQVEMAQLKYRSQRLLGQGLVLSRLAGGIGTRGPGESKLEVNRRRIRERLTDLRRELDEMEKQRTLRRQSREKGGVPVVALVGYTNTGKSSLLNKITGSDVYIKDRLFATLDAISRNVRLPDGGEYLLVDTVGFIRKLPTDLVEAFHSTLEEAALADVLVLVSDASSPDMLAQHVVVEQVLQQLGATSQPRIDVLNKCDKIEEADFAPLPRAIRVSAKTGEGLDQLSDAIAAILRARECKISVLVPFDQYGIVTDIRAMGRILSEEYTDHGTQVTAMVDAAAYGRLLSRYPAVFAGEEG